MRSFKMGQEIINEIGEHQTRLLQPFEGGITPFLITDFQLVNSTQVNFQVVIMDEKVKGFSANSDISDCTLESLESRETQKYVSFTSAKDRCSVQLIRPEI